MGKSILLSSRKNENHLTYMNLHRIENTINMDTYASKTFENIHNRIFFIHAIFTSKAFICILNIIKSLP